MTLPVQGPGVYDVAADDYHSQRICPGPSVSSTGLRRLLRECPARFWAQSDMNPDRVPQKEKKSLAFGRAAHALMLGEPEFHKHFIVSPFESFMTKEARHWRDEQTRQIVRPEELVIIRDMVVSQRKSDECCRAFKKGAPEKSIVWKDDETGIWLKVRPDWLPNDPVTAFITEYKTAETIQPRRLSSAVFEYGYEMQAALMLDGVRIVTGKPPVGIAHIAQEKEPPYLVAAFLFSEEHLMWGRMQYRKALRIFARCLEAGRWPAYTTEPTYFGTPFWVSKAMENFTDDHHGTSHSNTPDNSAYAFVL